MFTAQLPVHIIWPGLGQLSLDKVLQYYVLNKFSVLESSDVV